MSLSSSAGSLDSFAARATIAVAGGVVRLTTTTKKTKYTTQLQGNGGS